MKQIISLYSGADGLGFGAKLAGFPPTIAIETDSNCCKTIKLNNPECEVLNERIQDIADSLPKKPYAVIGGPPCQGFSPANPDRNFDLTLVNEFWGIVQDLKPKYFLMENVSDLKKKFNKISSFLINCADYGVPQTRLRRFWTNIPLPLTTHAKNPTNTLDGKNLKKWVSVKEALGLENGVIQDRRHRSFDKRIDHKRNYSIAKPSRTIITDTRFWLVSELKKKKITFQQRKFFHELNKPARTITTKDHGIQPSMMISDGIYARKLENEELATLQGFPKEFKFYGGKTSTHKQIGNAVPPPIGKAFFENTF